MTYHSHNLAALIGSRICHDLISPIGAVTNGLELLALSGTTDCPEMTLVNDSAANANARIRLFRMAFGLASADQTTGSQEIRDFLKGVYSDGRIVVNWMPTGDLLRRVAQAAVLSILCAEQAIPFGGTLTISESDGQWIITATGDRLKADPALWAALKGYDAPREIAPAHVQFILLPAVLNEIGRHCHYDISPSGARILF
ncbi:hypothetical protein PEL8287_00222 [Roseovarius litorisediminis]|uniref:Histidine phosphotransferase ChpT C-terminal domain-containing protein n=1 Tax=Roseovarius litorisediminis TaxID=1312363 RepID=A0A1Y5R8V6_9RHOB|nr:histidine phosphotransferase family protein [Roseovarius litorisediminis]SLN11133.1 hypothetical protein PEL8287_00222 [Roseovarius litorisediminis]